MSKAGDGTPATTLRVIIRGGVQGVGFRYAFADEARARGLCGWVRNRRDGCVEAIIAGPASDVDAMVAWSRRGPAAARVAGIETAAAEGSFVRFEIAPSV